MAKKRPIQIMHQQTRDIMQFSGMRACSRFLEVKVGTVYWKLQGRINIPFKGYFLRYADESTPWPDPKIIQATSHGITQGVDIALIDCKTGIAEHYKNMAEAGRKLGFSSSSILYRLRRQHEQKPYRGYFIRYWNHHGPNGGPEYTIPESDKKTSLVIFRQECTAEDAAAIQRYIDHIRSVRKEVLRYQTGSLPYTINVGQMSLTT